VGSHQRVRREKGEMGGRSGEGTKQERMKEEQNDDAHCRVNKPNRTFPRCQPRVVHRCEYGCRRGGAAREHEATSFGDDEGPPIYDH
jgi:hypothetical protein